MLGIHSGIDDIEDLVGNGRDRFSNSTPATSTRSVTPPRRSRIHSEVYAKQTTAPRQKKCSEGVQVSEVSSEIDSRSLIPGTQIIYMKTQGCSHNVSDSEYMAGISFTPDLFSHHNDLVSFPCTIQF